MDRFGNSLDEEIPAYDLSRFDTKLGVVFRAGHDSIMNLALLERALAVAALCVHRAEFAPNVENCDRLSLYQYSERLSGLWGLGFIQDLCGFWHTNGLICKLI